MSALPLLLFLFPLLQDPPAPPAIGGAHCDGQLLASDGEPVAPGRLPADTGEAARRLWAKVLGATHADALPAIHSFELAFDVRSLRPGASNRFDAGIAYLETDHPRSPFLRLYLQRKDLVSIHGPDGSWLIDGDTIQPLAGRDYAEDLRQLREYRSLAQNLLGLVQPSRLRVVSLRALAVTETPPGAAGASKRIDFADAGPCNLPTEELAQVARHYEWLELRSPDLRVYRDEGDARAGVYRGRMGIEPGSGEVRILILHAERDGVILPTRAILVEIKTYAELAGGYRLPRHFLVKEIDPTTRPLTFHRRDATEFGLIVGHSAVNPRSLTLEAFQPPH